MAVALGRCLLRICRVSSLYATLIVTLQIRGASRVELHVLSACFDMRTRTGQASSVQGCTCNAPRDEPVLQINALA